MKKKICYKCKRELYLFRFSFKNKEKNIYASMCKDCHSKYNKGWYNRNKESRIKNIANRKKEIQEFIRNYKGEFSCEICGESHPACLVFHHIDDNKKEYDVSTMGKLGLSKEKIAREISKCKILCANCHRKLHFGNLYE